MLNLNFIGDSKNYNVSFRNINKNVVEIIGDIPPKETGFILTRIGNPFAFKGNYTDFKTIYKEVEGGFQFSNDGSIYIEPLPKVTFKTIGGGTFEGEVMQEVSNYEDLVIPTPIVSENFEFVEWMPSIPASGAIDGNKSFTAIFKSTLPDPEPIHEPDPEPTKTIEERVATLENDVQMINDALGGE